MMTRVVMLAVLTTTLVTARVAEAADFVVIVNEANPTTSLPREAVAKLFLKETASWSHGPKVAPVDLDAKSATRADFTRAVHGRTLAAVLAFWNQKMFSGADVPPPQKASDVQAIEFVRANPGAVAYVSASAPLQRVKVLQVAN